MVGYLVGLATWPLGWTGESFLNAEPVWFSFFPALAALGAAMTTTPVRVFLYLAVVIVGAQSINYLVREPADRSPLLPDLVYGYGFGIIFVGAAVMAAREAARNANSRSSMRSSSAGAGGSNSTNVNVRYRKTY